MRKIFILKVSVTINYLTKTQKPTSPKSSLRDWCCISQGEPGWGIETFEGCTTDMRIAWPVMCMRKRTDSSACNRNLHNTAIHPRGGGPQRGVACNTGPAQGAPLRVLLDHCTGDAPGQSRVSHHRLRTVQAVNMLHTRFERASSSCESSSSRSRPAPATLIGIWCGGHSEHIGTPA